jgi:RNase P subunit RPR2
LTVTVCKTCGTVLIATKDKRMDFTEAEKQLIIRIAQLKGKKIRWVRRSIPDWAHIHLE